MTATIHDLPPYGSLVRTPDGRVGALTFVYVDPNACLDCGAVPGNVGKRQADNTVKTCCGAPLSK